MDRWRTQLTVWNRVNCRTHEHRYFERILRSMPILYIFSVKRNIIDCMDHIWLSVVNISYINCIETYTLVEVSSGAPMPGESLKWIGYIFTSVDMLNDYVWLVLTHWFRFVRVCRTQVRIVAGNSTVFAFQLCCVRSMHWPCVWLWYETDCRSITSV